MGLTLVTGGTGYLGRHLIDSLLTDRVPVRALVYSEWKGEELEGKGVEVIYGDVTDPETLAESGACDGVETVFHLVGGGNEGRLDPFEINTEGTRNMVEACKAAGLRAFVYVSSSTVYHQQQGWVDEETTPTPGLDYPRSKRDAENVLLDAAQELGFPATIARMGGIYGPDAPMLVTDRVRRGLRITGDGQNVISIIHIEDAVQGLRAMASRGRPGHVYCLCDTEPVPVYSFHNHYAELIGAPQVRTSSLRRARNIIRIVRFLSRLTGRKPILTEAVIAMATLHVMMRNTRMRDELGVELRYPTYREGLAQCAAWAMAEEEE
jgi:nucleoside-diphosphate-sugar epimerase